MQPERIHELLSPFLGKDRLEDLQIHRVTIYLDLLLRWNDRVNLTAIRDPEQIMTRHFGESFFAARHLLPCSRSSAGGILGGVQEEQAARPVPPRRPVERPSSPLPEDKPLSDFHINDIGSGAGFPGLPLKIWSSEIHLTLVESQHKKATFLREVVRALELTNIEVFAGRAEDYGTTADVVTLRAVERFERVLPVAANLVQPGGRLALLIGSGQQDQACQLHALKWEKTISIPLSQARVLLISTKPPAHESAE